MNFYGMRSRHCCRKNTVFLSLFFVVLVLVLVFEVCLRQMLQAVPRRSQIPVTTGGTGATEKRRNVIVLTHPSSGSTFIGNVFNLHPDVFYLYEPLHELRQVRYGPNEWQFLEKAKNDAYRVEFSSLIRDSFTCRFQKESTVKLIFAPWVTRLRNYMSWRLSSPQVTQKAVRDACEKSKLTIAKIMQMRLPREVGIQELKRICSSDLQEFDCLIIHLVRDPRAVLSSLIQKSFHQKGILRKQLASKENDKTKMQLIKQYAFFLCSLLEDNLNFVKRMPDWFDGHYKLIRYEDVIRDIPKAVEDLYKFAGLPMVETIRKWIFEGARPINESAKAFSMISVSGNITDDSWRFKLEPAMVSLFEEHCLPVMKLLGYLPVNGSEYVQHDSNRKLHTESIPFLMPG